MPCPPASPRRSRRRGRRLRRRRTPGRSRRSPSRRRRRRRPWSRRGRRRAARRSRWARSSDELLRCRSTGRGTAGWSIGAPAGSSSARPGNGGDVVHGRGAWTMSSPRKRTDRTRRRWGPATPPAACSVSMWKNTASPGSSSQPRIVKSSGRPSMSGSSASVPSGNHLAWSSRNDRGMNHSPRWEPATNSQRRLRGAPGRRGTTCWRSGGRRRCSTAGPGATACAGGCRAP